MGINVSVLDSESYGGKCYLPSQCLRSFPTSRQVAPGSVALCYSALPTGKILQKRPDNMFWWVDVQFLPYSDSTLVTSVGTYLSRPGRCSIPVNDRVLASGLIYSLHCGREHVEYEIIKGSSTSALPNVRCHPTGRHICYAARGSVVLMNMYNHRMLERTKAVRNNVFRSTDISPSGVYVATIARCSRHIELGVELVDQPFLISHGFVDCHKLCPGFYASRNFTDQLECRFSPDSAYVAASSSMGYLFVARRAQLELYCSVVPGMFDRDETRPANERSFDFNPCYAHSRLALGTDDGRILICDLDTKQVDMKTKLDSEVSIQSVKYSHSGNVLAVASSGAAINIHQPDTLDILYRLEGTVQAPEHTMQPGADGRLPEIIRMSYSTLGEHLAVSSTDGYIRVWQLQPDLLLRDLCRRAILKHVPSPTLQMLPLPNSIIQYLLQIPTKVFY